MISLERLEYTDDFDKTWISLKQGRDFTLAVYDSDDDGHTTPLAAPFGVGTYDVIATAVPGSGYTGSTDMLLSVLTRYDLW